MSAGSFQTESRHTEMGKAMERFKNYVLAAMGFVILAGAMSLTETGRAIASQGATLVAFTDASNHTVGNTVKIDPAANAVTVASGNLNVGNFPATMGINNFPVTQDVNLV